MLEYVGLRPKLYAIHHMKKDHEKDSWERIKISAALAKALGAVQL